MNGKIPQQFIDTLLNRLDIVDIINAHVPLKKAGKNHQACCPFHSEKTPSFTVNQPKQFYYCFGCGASGTAISFLMDYLNIGFIDAIESLASFANIAIPRETTTASRNRQQTTELYDLMDVVVKFYARQLREHKQADRMIDYLKQRGISGEIAAKFELGFAPPGWQNLLSELGKSSDSIQQLLKIGAIVASDKGNNNYYDRFRNRIIFPIRDQRGRAIGLGGRVLDNDEQPKYLNSPETPIFHKGIELYGLHQARKALKEIDRLYIVEGYMDVIALAQYGIDNAVASLGTAATTEHIKKMFHATNKLVFCFDGDEAGSKAAWRGLENVLPLLHDGKQVYFLVLPTGEDPDTFIRQYGKQDFISEQKQIPLSAFLFDNLTAGINLETSEGRYELINKTLPYLGQLPTSPYRDLLVTELATISNYTQQKIESQLVALAGNKPDDHPYNRNQHTRQPAQYIDTSRWLIRALLHQPSLANKLDSTKELATIESTGIRFVCELIEFIKAKPDVTLARILENWRDTRFEKPLQRLAADEDIINEINIITEDSFADTIQTLITSGQKQHAINTLKGKDSVRDLSEADKSRYRQMQKKIE